MSLDDYRRLFATLPEASRAKVIEAWGDPEDDPAVRGGTFTHRLARHGNIILAIQPDRGSSLDRKADYHDPDLPPRHAYVAFYLWLREMERIDAMIHLGTHGTLEWLPGKAVALSASCVPAAAFASRARARLSRELSPCPRMVASSSSAAMSASS